MLCSEEHDKQVSVALCVCACVVHVDAVDTVDRHKDIVWPKITSYSLL